MDLRSNFEAGHVCWDDHDIIHGKPTGAVRVSFGYMSTFEDAKKFIDFVTSSFVALPNWIESGYQLMQGSESRLGAASFYLKSITVYPIKSCAGFNVESWPLSTSAGLLHDREWVLTSLSGEILTQKKVPEMCFISTFIDLDKGILFVESPRCQVKLPINFITDSCNGGSEKIKLNGQRYEVQSYKNEVNIWFSNAIGRPCTLFRCFSSNHNFCLNKIKSASMGREMQSMLNFSNEAQFLLISEESVSDLSHRVSTNVQKGARGAASQISPMRFRPNIVVSGGEPYAEDGWKILKIGNKYFTSLGGCNRCQMINIVHDEAGLLQKSNEPLATLASYRRMKGKIFFGILLKYERSEPVGRDGDLWLQVGQDVHPNVS